ncbi:MULTISPECIES: HAD family acid phosphatase [unclassified Sphingomonas]|jgi:5'-nucleotidase (lipoprotein e(P4) family)|uniref:HAD family acid phosphatase n=1 Tax=unclassified Sphingomonas TaxID=196159 RepID=UPI000E1003DC|nr:MULTISPECIES: HAD family acid phosphatase [unclassified Sphingomonas]AXJ96062.1 acid phosphatase [Sphingomonas sp. FARSPH]
MKRALILALVATTLLAGCGRGQRVARLPAPGQLYTADGQLVQVTKLKALPAPDGSIPAPANARAGNTASPPPQFQYLYGSGEADALSRQAFRALVNYATYRRASGDSVVLKPGATLDAPQWVPCEGKPRAAIFDADETILLNLGVEALAARNPGAPFDAAQWARWERTGAKGVAPVPGAVEAFAALRAAGVAVIVNTNRSSATAAGTVATLKAAGLGDFTPDTDLFLSDGPSAKDPRRATIAARYCVVAMAGDQLGDFSDLFARFPTSAARRRAVDAAPIAQLWGNGWFVLPNPVYGAGLKGSYDDVFPADRRWVDGGAG